MSNTEAMRALLAEAKTHANDLGQAFQANGHYGMLYTHGLIERLCVALAQAEQRQRVPFDVEFAAAYLDGVMEVEHPEIQAKWAKVRAYLNAVAPRPEEPDLPAILQRQAS